MSLNEGVATTERTVAGRRELSLIAYRKSS